METMYRFRKQQSQAVYQLTGTAQEQGFRAGDKREDIRKMQLKYPVITISREYAAGGRTVAAELSRRLGIPFYDRDFVKKTVEQSGYSEEDIEREGETMSPSSKFMNSFLNNAITYPSSYDRIYAAQKEVVLELSKSPCIIIGRCADHILTEAGIPAFKVFLFADEEHRLKRAAELVDVTDEAALKKHLARTDVYRRTYYQKYTGVELGSCKNCNIALDTGTIGALKCADIICGLVAED